MKAFALIALFLLIFTASPSALASPPPIRGMALGLFSKEADYDYGKDLKELKALGVNAVLLVVNWYSADIRDNNIESRPDKGQENSTISDQRLKRVIAQAHELGI